jgi:hypothetical protein
MRLLLLWLVCLIGSLSCTKLHSPNTDYKHPKIDFSTPSYKYQELDEYYVRTRVVIEYAAILIEDEETIGTFILFAEHFNTIMKELKFTEDIFSDAHVNFHITQVEYRQYGDSSDADYLEDAANFKNHMTLYYRLPRVNEQFKGLSGGPYEGVHSFGILLSYIRSSWTMAHEVGHYLGLLHTFDEDYCKDTPTENKTCEEKLSQNCRNIMNYCDHEPKMITTDQIDRVEHFLRSRRYRSVIHPAPKTPLLSVNTFYKEMQVTAPNPVPTSQPMSLPMQPMK